MSDDPYAFGVELFVLVAGALGWLLWRKRHALLPKGWHLMKLTPKATCPCSPGTPVGDAASFPSATTPGAGSGGTYRILDETLRGTLRVLGVVLVVLIVAFLGSGIHFVEEGTVAIHTRFGRILGEPGQQIRHPGGPYLALPAPLDAVWVVPSTMQELVLDRSFWMQEVGDEADLPLDLRYPAPALNPERDGSLLTGDQNLVHARWSVSYRVETTAEADDGGKHLADAPLLFFRNVGSVSRAATLVSDAVERSIVHEMAQTPVDAFYRGDIDTERIRGRAQGTLDQLETGIRLMTVSLTEGTVPLATLREFQAAGQAESEKAQRMERARQERTRILHRVAGSAHQDILRALDAYEYVRMHGTAEEIAAQEARIDAALVAPDVGGAVSSMIRSAMTSRTQTVEFVRGASERFVSMLAMYEENPRLYRSRQIQDALERIFRGSAESFYLPPGEDKILYLELGREP